MTTRIQAELRRWAERLADEHERITSLESKEGRSPNHQAIAYCGCHVACDYRCVTGLLKSSGALSRGINF